MTSSSSPHRMNEESELARHDGEIVHGRRAVRLRIVISLGLLLGLLVSLSCNPKTQTVLQLDFNADTVGSPPAAAQTVGSVNFFTVSGTQRISVGDAPAPEAPGTKWVSITSNTITGTFVNGFGGLGTYGFLANLYIPRGTGIVTVKFQPDTFASAGSEFFHIDFMPEGDMRVRDINDIPVRFGQFPRDNAFLLSVKLVITQFSTDIEINLFGQGASGRGTVRVKPALIVTAQRFSNVSFGMQLVGPGTFFVDNVIVTRTP